MDFLNYAALFLYIGGMIAVAVVSRKKAGSVNDTLLAGRNVGGWMIAFAYGTTYFSAVIFIGYAGDLGYKFGLYSLFIGLFNAIVGALLPWLLLAKRTRRITHMLSTRTMPEFFEARYDSKWLKLLTASIVVVFLVPYCASVYKGLGYMFEIVFNIKFVWIIIIMAALTAAYTFFGGYFATTVSDFIQGIIMLAGIVVIVAFVYNYQEINGIISGISKINEARDEAGLNSFNIWQLICLVVLTSLGSWALPQIVHKFHTVKNEEAIKKATWISTGFSLIIGVGAYFVGCASVIVLSNAGALAPDLRVPNIFVSALPAGLLGFVCVLILSASMSTLSGLTLSAAGSGAIDIVKGYIKKDMSDKHTNILMRIICVAIIFISALIAILAEAGHAATIVNLMSLSWGVLSGAFIGPYVYGLFSKKATKAAAYTSIIGTLLITLVLYILSKTVQALAAVLFPPAIGVICMAYSLIIVPIVSAFTRPPDKQLIEKLNI